MNMVEKVARALCTRHYAQRFRKLEPDEHVAMNVNANWHMFEGEARAAIEAMMEPSEEMIEIGSDARRPGNSRWGNSVGTWKAMLRAALEEK